VTAPGTPGVATYTLTANSATGASTAAATATVNVGGNLDLVPVSGDKQSALPGQPLANPMIVRLVDGQGGPVSGVIVTWSDSNARDRLSVTSVATDGQGHASTVVTLSTDLGNRTITASAAGKSVTFTATAQIDLARAAVQLLAPMARSAVLSTRTQLDNVDQHLDDVRRTCNPGASGSAQAAVDGKRLGQVPWDGFVAGEINTNRQSTNAQQGGFKVSTNGITLGGDFSCTGNFVVGAAIGFFKGDITLDGGAGDQNAKGASVSGWGSFMPLPGAYFDFTAHYGRNDYDSRRASAAAATDLNSSTRGQQSAVAVKGGYQFKGEGPLQVDPYFRVEHIQADVNGFGEGGAADAIAVSDLKVKSTVSTFGGKLRYTFDTAHGEVTPHLRLELHRQSQESIDAVTARLVSAPDVMQTATLPQEDHNYGNFSLGASGTYDKHYEWYVNWEHLFGMQDVKGDSLTARFKYHF
jgi:outer membrane autotransporter protein